MSATVELPYWLVILIIILSSIAALDRILVPSVRWFFRRRMERAVERLNRRLARPIAPFKLAQRHDMILRLAYDAQVMQAVADHAAEAGVPPNVAAQQARAYAAEVGRTEPLDICFSAGNLLDADRSTDERHAIVDRLAAAGVTWLTIAPAGHDRAEYVELAAAFAKEFITT